MTAKAKGQRKVAAVAGDPTHIGELVSDPHNRRTHTPRNVGMIVDALQRVGASRSIVIDEHNEVLAGNGVLDAAAEAGITKVQVVDADGGTIIAVRRSGLTADQKRDLAIFDNRAGELAEWNIEQLEADLQDGADLTPFFTDDELRKLKVLPAAAAGNVADELVTGQFLVVITCADEAQQVALLERLSAEGLACKALVS